MAKQPEDQKTRELVPTVRAYLRVSTDAQDVANQRHGILEYAVANHLGGLVFVEDSESSKVDWRKRKLGAMLAECQRGDVLVFAEISRMARSTLEVLEVLRQCVDAGVIVHIAKSRMVLDDSLNSRITATVLGLAAEIEREFIRMRTTEALAARKRQIEQDGSFVSKAGRTVTRMGRPPGKASKLRLDAQDAEIRGYLAKGINKRDIARLIDCSPATLYDWIARRIKGESND